MACNWRNLSPEDFLKLAILVASVLGLVIGLSLSLTGTLPGKELLAWIGIWGELFLRLLEMAALPLVVTLVITGIYTSGHFAGQSPLNYRDKQSGYE